MNLKTLANWLLIIGGLNWLLYAFGHNLISAILGSVSWLEKLVYIAVGLSALWVLFDMFGGKASKKK